jgi:hypothetical protein
MPIVASSRMIVAQLAEVLELLCDGRAPTVEPKAAELLAACCAYRHFLDRAKGQK